MGKSSSTEGELSSILHAPGKSGKEDISPPSQMIDSSNRENGSSLDAGSSIRIGIVENISPSKSFAPCFENQICQNKRDQTFCSVDCEAALPPSKRLRRALETMSANAAEEGLARIESSASRMTLISTCCIAAIKTCPNTTINDHEGGGLELQKFSTCDGDSSHTIVPSLPANSNQVDKLSTRFQPQETGKDVLPGAADKVEDLSDSMVYAPAKIDSQVEMHEEISPNLNSKCYEVEGNQDSPDQMRIGSNNPTTGDTSTFEIELESSSSTCYVE